jgi:hypothetical protein
MPLPRKFDDPELADKVRAAYWRDARSLSWISKNFGVSLPALARLMVYFEIPRRPAGRPRKAERLAQLTATAYRRGQSLRQLADRMGVTPQAVANMLRRYGYRCRELRQ